MFANSWMKVLCCGLVIVLCVAAGEGQTEKRVEPRPPVIPPEPGPGREVQRGIVLPPRLPQGTPLPPTLPPGVMTPPSPLPGMPPVRPRDERTDEFGKLCDKLCPEGKEREAFEKRRANESAVAAVRLENEAAKLEAMQKAHLEAIQEREAALRSAGLRHNEGLAALMQAEQETLDARLALEPRIDRRRALRQKYLDRLQTREKEIDKRVASGDGVYAPVDAFTCKAARIAAEIALHCESCSGVRPEEHEILENQVDILYQTYQRIKFLYEFGSDGGDFAAMAVTGHALCRALADLELARGNHAKALAHSRDAARMAATSLRAVQVSYEHGDTTIRSVLEEQSRCLATKLRLLRLKRQVGEASSNIDSATEKGQ